MGAGVPVAVTYTPIRAAKLVGIPYSIRRRPVELISYRHATKLPAGEANHNLENYNWAIKSRDQTGFLDKKKAGLPFWGVG